MAYEFFDYLSKLLKRANKTVSFSHLVTNKNLNYCDYRSGIQRVMHNYDVSETGYLIIFSVAKTNVISGYLVAMFFLHRFLSI